MTVGVLIVGVLTVGASTVGELTVGASTVGVLPVEAMLLSRDTGYSNLCNLSKNVDNFITPPLQFHRLFTTTYMNIIQVHCIKHVCKHII